jgi:hypothetical protein
MAKVRNNIIMQGLSGLLGNQLVIRQDKAGRTIISAKPQFKPNRTFSDQQIEHQRSFREAAAYAQSVRTMEVYVNKATGTLMNPYNLALSDWFHAPEILDVNLGDWTGQPDKVLRIKVIDDVLVAHVEVDIRDGSGATLEHGAAAQVDSMWWEYTTRVSASGNLTVQVSARDIPHNITKTSKTL